MTASVVMSPFPERRCVWTLVVRRTFHRNCLDAAMHSPLPQRVKRKQICGTYSHRATSQLYRKRPNRGHVANDEKGH